MTLRIRGSGDDKFEMTTYALHLRLPRESDRVDLEQA